MRIAVLHNAVDPRAATPDEQDTLVQVESVSSALAAIGHAPVAVSCGLDLEAVATKLRALEPDLVFNLVESIAGSGRLIHLAPSLLDQLGLGFTGSPTDALYLTSSKLLAKSWLRLRGLPVPEWVTIDELRAGRVPPAGRLIIKSVWEHASIGLDESSILEPESGEALRAEMERRRPSLGGTCFAEGFVPGREFNLSVIERGGRLAVLPPAEIVFEGYAEDQPKVVGYRAKWEESSYEFHHTPRRFAFPPEDAPLVELLAELALRACRGFGVRGYARVDFRVDESGLPFILEVNANPCLSPDAGFAAAAAEAGIGYAALVETIVQAAVGGRAPSAAENEGIAFRGAIEPGDRAAVEEAVRATRFFTEAEVGVALELVDAALEKGSAASGYCFLLAGPPNGLDGYTCFGPIAGTVSSFDLFWIVVHPRAQRRRLGRALLEETERRIAAAGGTRVVAETSGRRRYTPTRRFYEANGYVLRAVVDDFYAPGDAKLIFVKAL